MADMGTDKQRLFLVPGDKLTVEVAADLLKQLTGREVSPEDMARLLDRRSRSNPSCDPGRCRRSLPPISTI